MKTVLQSAFGSLSWPKIIWVTACIISGFSCTEPTNPPPPAPIYGFTNIQWKVNHYKVKKMVGMIYRNLPQLEKKAREKLDAGMSWHFFQDGRFTMAEGNTLYFGQWIADSPNKSLNCYYLVNGRKEVVYFKNVFLSEQQMTADLHFVDISYEARALAESGAADNFKSDPFYPK